MSKLSKELIERLQSLLYSTSAQQEARFKEEQDRMRLKTRIVYPMRYMPIAFPDIRIVCLYSKALNKTFVMAESKEDRSSHHFIRSSKYIQNHPTSIGYIVMQNNIDGVETFALSGIPKSWKRYVYKPKVESVWGWMSEHLDCRVTPVTSVRDLVIYALILGYNSCDEVMAAVEKHNTNGSNKGAIKAAYEFLELEYRKMIHKMSMSEIAQRTADAWKKFESIPELNK